MRQLKLDDDALRHIRKAAKHIGNMKCFDLPGGCERWEPVFYTLKNMAKHGTNDGKPWVEPASTPEPAETCHKRILKRDGIVIGEIEECNPEPIDVGDGWRPLAKDEPVTKGDEFKNYCGDWERSKNYLWDGKQSVNTPYRRRIASPSPVHTAETYAAGQAAWGGMVGDWIKVMRKAEQYEQGWPTSWNPEMDAAVGKSFQIQNRSAPGFQLSNDFWFPYFVLEKTTRPIDNDFAKTHPWVMVRGVEEEEWKLDRLFGVSDKTGREYRYLCNNGAWAECRGEATPEEIAAGVVE